MCCPGAVRNGAADIQSALSESAVLAKVKNDHHFRPYIEAVQQGYLNESGIETALVRLFTARIRLDLSDPPGIGKSRLYQAPPPRRRWSD